MRPSRCGCQHTAPCVWLSNAKGDDLIKEKPGLLDASSKSHAKDTHKLINIITSCAQDGQARSIRGAYSFTRLPLVILRIMLL